MKLKPSLEKLGTIDNDRKLNIFEKRVSLKKAEVSQVKNSMLAAQFIKLRETNERALLSGKSEAKNECKQADGKAKEVKITDTTLIAESSSDEQAEPPVLPFFIPSKPAETKIREGNLSAVESPEVVVPDWDGQLQEVSIVPQKEAI